jgi:hypothetical protein
MKTVFDGFSRGLGEPYQPRDVGPDRIEVNDDHGRQVAAFYIPLTSTDEAWANARLFKAAPDLLRVAIELAEALDGLWTYSQKPSITWNDGTSNIPKALAAFYALVDPVKP